MATSECVVLLPKERGTRVVRQGHQPSQGPSGGRVASRTFAGVNTAQALGPEELGGGARWRRDPFLNPAPVWGETGQSSTRSEPRGARTVQAAAAGWALMGSFQVGQGSPGQRAARAGLREASGWTGVPPGRCHFSLEPHLPSQVWSSIAPTGMIGLLVDAWSFLCCGHPSSPCNREDQTPLLRLQAEAGLGAEPSGCGHTP